MKGKAFVLFLACFIYNDLLFAQNKIAVVKNRYDNVERVLRVYKIDFDIIEVKDLIDFHYIQQYRSIYLPSGVDKSLETNINVLARKKSIQSVNLKQNVTSIDNPVIVRNIKRFIENGGSVYCSGYSYKLLQKAYDPFIFHQAEDVPFPNLGLPGRIEVTLHNDFTSFCLKPSLALYMNYSGWITLQAVREGQVMTSGSFESPIGEKHGPISVLFQYGKGEALYTSYYNTVYSEYKRFNVLRVAGGSLLNRLENEAEKWTQKVTGRLVDLIADNEHVRKYSFNLTRGDNTVYFLSKQVPYQVDIYDDSMSLLESRDGIQGDYSFNIHMNRDSICFVKIFPVTTKRNGLYSFVVASGKQVRSKWIYIIIISSIFLVFVSLVVIIRIMRHRMYISMLRKH